MAQAETKMIGFGVHGVRERLKKVFVPGNGGGAGLQSDSSQGGLMSLMSSCALLEGAEDEL